MTLSVHLTVPPLPPHFPSTAMLMAEQRVKCGRRRSHRRLRYVCLHRQTAADSRLAMLAKGISERLSC